MLERDGEFQLLVHLVAAGSLHRMQDRSQRDESLRRALRVAKDIKGAPRSADEAPRLLAAEWALDDRDAPRALEALAALPAGVARRTHALRLKLKAACMARRPMEALHTARLLANHQAFSPDVAQSLTRSLAREVLDEAHAIDQLHRLWSQFDAAERRDPQVVALAARRAVRLEAPADGRQWLRASWDTLGTLSSDDQRAIALALIEARSGIGSDWLPRLEQALTSAGHESAVSAAVGMAYADRGLWGKARLLLEQTAGARSSCPTARGARSGASWPHWPEKKATKCGPCIANRPPRHWSKRDAGLRPVKTGPLAACYTRGLRAAVAQLDRVLGYEPRGRGFDSCQPHHKNKKRINGLDAFGV